MTISNQRHHCCLNCGSSMGMAVSNVFDTRFGIDEMYDIEVCRSCNMLQLLPLPSADQLRSLYNRYYNYVGEKEGQYKEIRERFIFSFFYRLLIIVDGDISFHSKKGTGTLLDIGCNEGRGLKIYQRAGFSAEGLELNETAAEVARAQGFRVYTEIVDTFQPVTNYDVAVLSNVLEHSLNPNKTLWHAFRILKPGGQLWISCPNNRSWLRHLFGRYWINWHVPFHIVHFSQDSLQKLLHEAGFEVVEMRQETPALWVSHSIIARIFARRGKPTRQLRNPFLAAGLMLFIRGLLFPVLWLGNMLGRGDCLVVTAKKTS